MAQIMRACLALLASSLLQQAASQTSFISSGALWKYHSGSDPGVLWNQFGYNDSAWLQGPSPLGFGDGDEATVIPGGPAGNRYPTHYFRHQVMIAHPELFPAFILRVKRDDGIVVYINGAEVFRDNISGIPSYNSWASGPITDDGNAWLTAILPSSLLMHGVNLIAAEVHQINASSSDLSFDLELSGGLAPPITITRGPYLQLSTPNSIYLRWTTSIATVTRVDFGITPDSLNQSIANTVASSHHSIQLTGLSPATRYFYAIRAGNQTLLGDSTCFFFTPPLPGSGKTVRVWVTGDCGTGQSVQTNVMHAYQNFIGNQYTDLWLLLGDNAYNNGTEQEYHTNFFQPYMNGKVMRQTVIFPTPGNHDYANNVDSLESRFRPYFQLFDLPTAGETGGIPSGTEMYYSFDYANVHFISLDSYGTENGSKLFDTTSAQISWLKQDLAHNTQKWTIVYWHHPPYTKGSHNSDTEYELIQIRDKVIRLLDQYKVDLVLCGHSHNYERSKIMKGHYGTESTFNPLMHNFSSSSALYNGSANSCPYIKSSSSPQNEGIVYIVAGSAGKLEGTSSGYPHNAMYYSNSQQGGSLYLEITGNRLDGKWIAEDGSVPDQFTIMKDVNIHTTLNASAGDSIQLTASWEGLYDWSPPAPSAKSITVSPLVSSLYVVDDSFYNCLQDSFYIQVLVTISGYVHTRNGNPVKGVAMILSGDRNDTTITDEAGFYTFSAEAGGNYLITALATDSTASNSEISTVDILHIRRHILHTDTLSPHQIIAADVNESKDVSSADIAWIRSVILDNLPGFPSGKQWEFIQSDEVFGDPLHPFPFSSTRTYSLLNSHHMDQNFIGIRLGDVYNPGEPSGH